MDDIKKFIADMLADAEAMKHAPGGGMHNDDTFHAFNWSDKPTRVLYDALTWIHRAAEKLKALSEEHEKILDILEDPDAVHLNLLHGKIARPTEAQIMHIYPLLRVNEDYRCRGGTSSCEECACDTEDKVPRTLYERPNQKVVSLNELSQEERDELAAAMEEELDRMIAEEEKEEAMMEIIRRHVARVKDDLHLSLIIREGCLCEREYGRFDGPDYTYLTRKLSKRELEECKRLGIN